MKDLEMIKTLRANPKSNVACNEKGHYVKFGIDGVLGLYDYYTRKYIGVYQLPLQDENWEILTVNI